MWACKPLRTQHFHEVPSRNQHPSLLKSRYGKVRSERQSQDTEPSTAVVRATAALQADQRTWEQLTQRKADLEEKGVHRSPAEAVEVVGVERQLADYPAHLRAMQRAVDMAFETTTIDQVTAAAPAKIAALIQDHHDLQAWMFEGVALAKRYRGHRLELEQLLAQLPRELHERVHIGTTAETIAQLPALLRALMEDEPGWLIETTLDADKGTQDLPGNLYERYREVIDLRRKRDAAMRAAAEESGLAWVTVYEARTGRPVPMRPTDAAEALAIGHHQAEPPQWATA
jgi:hypothetical protein